MADISQDSFVFSFFLVLSENLCLVFIFEVVC